MADVKYCGECGTKLKAGVPACPKCGSDPSKTTKFCSSCGTAKASPNAIMCVKCGGALTRPSSEKDPGTAALISIICMFILGAPAIGYFYLGNMRKGLAYLVAGWVIVIPVAIITSLTCCFPLLLLPLALDLLIVYDVYLEAKGEEAKLPSF